MVQFVPICAVVVASFRLGVSVYCSRCSIVRATRCT